MGCSIFFIFILSAVLIVTKASRMRVDGILQFGPELKYKYRIKTLDSDEEEKEPLFDSREIAQKARKDENMMNIIIKKDNTDENSVETAKEHNYRGDNVPVFLHIYGKHETPAKTKKQRISNEGTIKPKYEHTEPPKKFNKPKNGLKTSNTVKHQYSKHKTTKKDTHDPFFDSTTEVETYQEYSKEHKSSSVVESVDEHNHLPKRNDRQKTTKIEALDHAFDQTTKDVVFQKYSGEYKGFPVIESKDEDNHHPKRTNRQKTTKIHSFDQTTEGVAFQRYSEEYKEYKGFLGIKTMDENNHISSTPKNSKKSKHLRKKEKKTDILRMVTQSHDITEQTADEATVEDFSKQVTTLLEPITYKDLYVPPQLVKNDAKIKEFAKHVYEQSIKALKNIKEKIVDDAMKRETAKIMRTYEDKFGDFVKETQNQKIKTRLGKRKVILNTLETSNRILERLVRNLVVKMDKKGTLRSAGGENISLNELKKINELENKHVCSKMHICRSLKSFTNFLADILTIILSSKDRKVIQFRDASTEVLKNTNFNDVIGSDTKKRFLKAIENFEKYDVNKVRATLAITKNILSSQNAPIKVEDEDSRVNKTLSFLEVMHALDEKVLPNERNKLVWKDLSNGFKEWSKEIRNDIVDIIQRLIDHVLEEYKKNNGNARSFDRNVLIILG